MGSMATPLAFAILLIYVWTEEGLCLSHNPNHLNLSVRLLRGRDHRSSGLLISWDKPDSGASDLQYELYERTVSVWHPLYHAGSGTQYFWRRVAHGQTYHFKVKIIDGNDSYWSEVVHFTLKDPLNTDMPSRGVIAGVTIGAVVAVGLLAALIFWLDRWYDRWMAKKRKKSKEKDGEEGEDAEDEEDDEADAEEDNGNAKSWLLKGGAIVIIVNILVLFTLIGMI